MLIPPPTLAPSRLAAVVPGGKGRRLAVAVCVLALLPGAAMRGDIQKPSQADGRGKHGAPPQAGPPPSAVAGKARVSLDGSVEIVLQAHGGESQEVAFLIRQPPAHGALAGPPRQLTRNTAAVTYVHRASDGAPDDAFTFAVQVTGGKVSAPEPVVISVADAGPDLVAAPTELDFGAVNAGDTTGAEITLENRGGGIAAGEFVPPAPWEVDGPSRYRLGHGARQTFAIVFRPVRGESFSETMRLPGQGNRRSVRLVGIGLSPVPAPAAVAVPVAAPAPEAPPPAASVPPADPPVAESAPLAPMAPAPLAAPAITPDPPPAPPSVASVRPRENSPAGLMIFLAAFFGLVLGVCVALSLHRWRQRRRSEGSMKFPVSAGGAPAKERICQPPVGPEL